MNYQRGIIDPVTILVAGLVISGVGFLWSIFAPAVGRYSIAPDGKGGYVCMDTATRVVVPCIEASSDPVKK